jgi:acyl carrier protein
VSTVTAEAVREVVLSHIAEGLERSGHSVDEITDETDLFAEQLIDSFGMLELLVTLEEHFQATLDFESIDADDITVFGPFCRYVEAMISSGAAA